MRWELVRFELSKDISCGDAPEHELSLRAFRIVLGKHKHQQENLKDIPKLNCPRLGGEIDA